MEKQQYRAALTACSNGLRPESRPELGELHRCLEDLGILVRDSACLFEDADHRNGTGRQRAQALMDCYRDPKVQAIFDISGGDLANEILPYLDFETIGASSKTFWGYSDLTTVLNAIYAKTGRSSVLYQVRNLLYDHGAEQQQRLQQALFGEGKELFRLKLRWLQGETMEGILLGGNIRCLLKLAGTPYWPDFRGKLLLLEACSGLVPQMITYLSQLQQLGVFAQVSGILLGTYTQMEQVGCKPHMADLIGEFAGDLPIARTEEIGHGTDSKAVRIGTFYEFHRA